MVRSSHASIKSFIPHSIYPTLRGYLRVVHPPKESAGPGSVRSTTDKSIVPHNNSLPADEANLPTRQICACMCNVYACSFCEWHMMSGWSSRAKVGRQLRSRAPRTPSPHYTFTHPLTKRAYLRYSSFNSLYNGRAIIWLCTKGPCLCYC